MEFREKRYENACEQYTSALGCLPKDQEKDRRVKYLCNRAACHVKLVRILFISGYFILLLLLCFFLGGSGGFEYVRDYYTTYHSKKAKTEKKKKQHSPICKELTYYFHFNIHVIPENIHTPQQKVFQLRPPPPPHARTPAHPPTRPLACPPVHPQSCFYLLSVFV